MEEERGKSKKGEIGDGKGREGKRKEGQKGDVGGQ